MIQYFIKFIIGHEKDVGNKFPKNLGINCIGFEINADYVELCNERLTIE